MKTATLPSFNEVQTIFNQIDAFLHAAELHGFIAGLLIGHQSTEMAWLAFLQSEITKDKTHPLLQTLFVTSQNQLQEFLFEFNLLLPDDEAELDSRAEALTFWCQGFLAGIHDTPLFAAESENLEVKEAIKDITEIAKMNYEAVSASEEDEEAYFELVEYVRMAVIFIYQETHESSSIH